MWTILGLILTFFASLRKCLVEDQNNVLVIGGYGGTSGQIVSTIELIQANGQSCLTILPDIPEDRYFPSNLLKKVTT
jgi:hypothetical protein